MKNAAPSKEFVLWFVNSSGRSGSACVYHDATNVTFNLGAAAPLAWMLASANASVCIEFVWQLDYSFAWLDYNRPRKQQLVPAAVDSTNKIALSSNDFGFTFGSIQTGGASGSLTIAEDASIPSRNAAAAGIGMHGAGTFAYGAQPNQSLVFTPAAALSYLITFGNYTFSVNDILPISSLNPSGSVSYPSGVYTMTAELDASNVWNVRPGTPMAMIGAPGASHARTIRYEAGRGMSRSSSSKSFRKV